MHRMSRRIQVFAIALGSTLAVAGSIVPSAGASPEACALISRSTIARDLGLAHVQETPSTPVSGPEAGVAQCRVVVWSGKRSKASFAKDTLAQLDIKAANESHGGDAVAQLLLHSAEENSGSHLRGELWNVSHLFYGFQFDTPAGGHEIEGLWSGSKPDPTGQVPALATGSYVAVTFTIGQHLPSRTAFAELNKILEVAVPAFLGASVTSGSFV
jgi:hypothetical protein